MNGGRCRNGNGICASLSRFVFINSRFALEDCPGMGPSGRRVALSSTTSRAWRGRHKARRARPAMGTGRTQPKSGSLGKLIQRVLTMQVIRFATFHT